MILDLQINNAQCYFRWPTENRLFDITSILLGDFPYRLDKTRQQIVDIQKNHHRWRGNGSKF